MSRKGLILGLSAALIAAGAAAETPPAVQQAFGNTLLSTYPDGRTAELWLQADGAYAAKGRRGDPSSGHWSVKDDKLCLSQSRPLPVPFHYCTPIPKGGMAKSWSAKAVTGEKIRVKLVKGGAPDKDKG